MTQSPDVKECTDKVSMLQQEVGMSGESINIQEKSQVLSFTGHGFYKVLETFL